MPIYDQVLASRSLPAVDRILLDLGLLVRPVGGRRPGFQLSSDGPLDLRQSTQVAENRLPISSRGWMNSEPGKSSSSLEKKLHSRRIARNIVAMLPHNPIRTAWAISPKPSPGPPSQLGDRPGAREGRDTAWTPPGHAHFSVHCGSPSIRNWSILNRPWRVCSTTVCVRGYCRLHQFPFTGRPSGQTRPSRSEPMATPDPQSDHGLPGSNAAAKTHARSAGAAGREETAGVETPT